MAFFAKFRRKLRTKNLEAHFLRKSRTLEKCSNVKKLRTAEPQPILLVLIKKKVYARDSSYFIALARFYFDAPMPVYISPTIRPLLSFISSHSGSIYAHVHCGRYFDLIRSLEQCVCYNV